MTSRRLLARRVPIEGLTLRQRRSFAFFSAVLLAYLLFDRAAAWVHVPGTPVFLGEVALGAVLLAFSRELTIGAGWRRLWTVRLLFVFMSIGFVRLIAQIFDDPIDSLRDSAIWSYGLVGVVVIGVLRWHPWLLESLIAGYLRVLGFALFWLTVATPATAIERPLIPDSTVSVFSHKAGNVGVHAALAFVFVWCLPHQISTRRRTVYSVVALGAVLLAGTQSRGGLLSAMLAITILLTTMKHGARLARTLGLTLAAAVIALFILDPSIDLGTRRDVSFRQLTTNLGSVAFDGGDGTELSGTVSWRLEHWTDVVEGVTEDAFLVGHGFGPNIAELYLIPQADLGLRNPHNSHLSVYARMGVIGAVVWLALWSVWFRSMWRAMRSAQRVGDLRAGVLIWCIAAAGAILFNGIFDPILEGPQVAFWLWLAFGMGVHVARLVEAELPRASGRLRTTRSLNVDGPPIR